MTTTLPRTATASVPVTTATATATATATGTLLALLADALSAVEEHDPGRLHSTSAAGSALVALAASARQAAGLLGAEPGVPLLSGPGVVVVRDLVAATRLLARASGDRTSAAGAEVARLVPPAKGLHAALLEAMTAAA